MVTDPRLKDMTTRIAHSEELGQLVASEIIKRPTAEWQALLKDADIPVFPVHTFESLVADPHLADVGFFREEQHPAVGSIREMAVPSEWHGTPPEGYRPPPRLGEHSAEVLAEAGYSGQEIASLLESGVTCQAPLL
jgi:crotonobetainyl-CoA:carnitine CoA-transferase CaiB-like acyl-CoA transferase